MIQLCCSLKQYKRTSSPSAVDYNRRWHVWPNKDNISTCRTETVHRRPDSQKSLQDKVNRPSTWPLPVSTTSQRHTTERWGPLPPHFWRGPLWRLGAVPTGTGKARFWDKITHYTVTKATNGVSDCRTGCSHPHITSSPSPHLCTLSLALSLTHRHTNRQTHTYTQQSQMAAQNVRKLAIPLHGDTHTTYTHMYRPCWWTQPAYVYSTNLQM